mgnify:CR=1 FL=1
MIYIFVMRYIYSLQDFKLILQTIVLILNDYCAAFKDFIVAFNVAILLVASCCFFLSISTNCLGRMANKFFVGKFLFYSSEESFQVF